MSQLCLKASEAERILRHTVISAFLLQHSSQHDRSVTVGLG